MHAANEIVSRGPAPEPVRRRPGRGAALFLALALSGTSALAGATASLAERALAADPAEAGAGSGLRWPTWQGLRVDARVAVARVEPGPADGEGGWLRWRLLGDLYLLPSSGWRATGGLLWGVPGTAWGLAPRLPGLVAPASHPGLLGDRLGETRPDGATYLGLGWSTLSSRSGWSFAADVGLLSLSPRSAVRFGRVIDGRQGFDELLRDLRLMPTVQLGASWAF
jgi:hypothetical protein